MVLDSGGCWPEVRRDAPATAGGEAGAMRPWSRSSLRWARGISWLRPVSDVGVEDCGTVRALKEVVVMRLLRRVLRSSRRFIVLPSGVSKWEDSASSVGDSTRVWWVSGWEEEERSRFGFLLLGRWSDWLELVR